MSAQSTDNLYLNLLRDLVLHLAAEVDCTIFLFAASPDAIGIGFSGLDEASFLTIRESLLEEVADSIIPLDLSLVRFENADDSHCAALAGASVWKRRAR